RPPSHGRAGVVVRRFAAIGLRRTLTPVPAEIEPPELARLVDYAERSRTDDWSLRSALVLYALPQPQRVNDVLVQVRRLDGALGKRSKRLQREGAEVWGALQSGADDDELVALLQAAR